MSDFSVHKRPKDDLQATTKCQGHGYTHIDLGKLLKNLNSKKKASMYLLTPSVPRGSL